MWLQVFGGAQLAQLGLWAGAVLSQDDPIDWVAYFDLAAHLIGLSFSAYGWFTLKETHKHDDEHESEISETEEYY